MGNFPLQLLDHHDMKDLNNPESFSPLPAFLSMYHGVYSSPGQPSILRCLFFPSACWRPNCGRHHACWRIQAAFLYRLFWLYCIIKIQVLITLKKKNLLCFDCRDQVRLMELRWAIGNVQENCWVIGSKAEYLFPVLYSCCFTDF